MDHYDPATGWRPLFLLVLVGVLMIGVGILIQMYGLFIAILRRNKHRDLTGNPWNGRTLEWATSSPPPEYNFAIIPVVTHRDPLWSENPPAQPKHYEDIYLPENTSIGVLIGAFSMTLGFGLIWFIWWMAALSAIAIVVCLVIRLSTKEKFKVIPAAEVKKIEEAHKRRAQAV